MHSLTPRAGALALLGALGIAQSPIDASRVYPITVPIQDAGVYDFKSGQFYPRAQAGALGAGIQTVFRNTCHWTGGGFYVGSGNCDEYFDEGRIPWVADGASGAVGPGNRIDVVEFAYCTATLTGAVDIETQLWDSGDLGAACPGPFQFRPDANGILNVVTLDFGLAAGFPLPGSPATGSLACWFVTTTLATPFCLSTGATAADLFFYTYLMKNTDAQNAGVPAGPILAGEPLIDPGGAGTYNIPPATGGLYGVTPCGHGLGAADAFWINLQGVAPGGNPPPACGVNSAATTSCAWFGGHPGNPFAGTWYRLESLGECSSCIGNVVDFCLPGKVNSLGCIASYTHTGIPDANAGTGFVFTTTNLLGNKNGLYFYGTNGTFQAVFQGYFLCPKPPIKRLSVLNSGGSGTLCNGAVSTDFNVWIASGLDTALVAGAFVGSQYWSRDPASPSTTNLTSAKSFTICP